MNSITSVVTPAAILRAFNVRRIRDTGITFLVNVTDIENFAKLAKVRDRTVIDLGCGPLILTDAAINLGAKQLYGVEDRGPFFSLYENYIFKNRYNPVYFHTVNPINFDYGKIQGVDPVDWKEDTASPLSVIANISFKDNIPLLLQYAHAASLKDGVYKYGRVPLTISISTPLAQDIINGQSYSRSRISTIINAYFHIVGSFSISASSFRPAPRVGSQVLCLIPKKNTAVDVPFVVFEQVIKIFFKSPSQMIGTKLSEIFHEKPEHTAKFKDHINMYLGKRVCELTMTDWTRISRIYYEVCRENNLTPFQTAINRADPMMFNGKNLSYFDKVDVTGEFQI